MYQQEAWVDGKKFDTLKPLHSLPFLLYEMSGHDPHMRTCLVLDE